MSREMTLEEVRSAFLDHIWGIIEYWENEPSRPEIREKLEGAAFSILAMLDGVSDLPGFIVAPDPHGDDKDYSTENEEDYWPENLESDVVCDISGSLHEEFYRR